MLIRDEGSMAAIFFCRATAGIGPGAAAPFPIVGPADAAAGCRGCVLLSIPASRRSRTPLQGPTPAAACCSPPSRGSWEEAKWCGLAEARGAGRSSAAGGGGRGAGGGTSGPGERRRAPSPPPSQLPVAVLLWEEEGPVVSTDTVAASPCHSLVEQHG
ncbi:hypothetical protein U9M48_022052 [Paspalum notatum var. saurae]|uniref:Uncharacterized protein n=1 Tax=Paspalum notatum var. saurae TaxID=547442 RepID=A0AAQ3WUL8_PASNO